MAGWFRTILDAIPRLLFLQTVCCNAELDISLCSTSLHPGYVPEKFTHAELRQHTFTGALTPSVGRKQCKSKLKNQGFLLFSNKHSVPKTVAEEDRDLSTTIRPHTDVSTRGATKDRRR